MGVPNHMLTSLRQTFHFEGGYVAHDMHNYPALFGFSAAFLQEDMGRHGVHITEKQAADDLTFMYRSHLQGHDNTQAPNSKISYAHLSSMRYEKAYDTYFKNQGFEDIANHEVQKYIMEFSFNRGANSARWGILYAAGAIPRDGDPLLKNNTHYEMSSATDYANGFLASGRDNTTSTEHHGDAHTNMIRFNGRLRVAKMVQESQFAATHNNRESVLGRFNRAFEFGWPPGTDINHPGLDPVKDRAFLNAYNVFKGIYQDYHSHSISHAQFDQQMAGFSVNLLQDPNLPSNGGTAVNFPLKGQPSHKAPSTMIAHATAHVPARHDAPREPAAQEIVYYIGDSLHPKPINLPRLANAPAPAVLTAQYYSNLFGSHIALEAPGVGIVADLSINSKNEVVGNSLNAAGVTFQPTHEQDLNEALGPNHLQVYDGTIAPASIRWTGTDGKRHVAILAPDVIASIRNHAPLPGWHLPNMSLATTTNNHLDPARTDTLHVSGTHVDVVDGVTPQALSMMTNPKPTRTRS